MTAPRMREIRTAEEAETLRQASELSREDLQAICDLTFDVPASLHNLNGETLYRKPKKVRGPR